MESAGRGAGHGRAAPVPPARADAWRLTFDFGACFHVGTDCGLRPCRFRALAHTKLGAELTDALNPGPRPVFWSCTADGRPRGDIGPRLDLRTLLELLDALWVGMPAAEQGYTETQVFTVVADGDVLTVRVVRGGEPDRELVLTRLPDAWRSLLGTLFTGSPSWWRRPAGWPSAAVAALPPAELELWERLVTGARGVGRTVDERFDALVAARTRLHPAPFTAAERDVLAGLAGGWAGTAAELFTTATGVLGDGR